MSITEYEKNNVITLPDTYKKMCISLNGYTEFLYDSWHEQTGGTEPTIWQIYDQDSLFTKINISGKSVKKIESLKICVANFLEKRNKNHTSFNSEILPLSRIEKSICIGMSDDGDYLYLDPSDNYSVWVFHHDDGSVRFLENNFGNWLGHAAKQA